jgi:hypothetical protein
MFTPTGAVVGALKSALMIAVCQSQFLVIPFFVETAIEGA